MTTKNYNIITVDGGGFHGIIPAMILDDLITSYPGFLDSVDLFGGTSTGAIISLGLASRLMMTPALISFYETKGPQVFQAYKPPGSLGMCHLHPELCYPQYTNTGQISALEPYFGTATFQDLKTSALVTTFAISNEEDRPWEPLAIHNLVVPDFLGIKLLDAVMCSSSPPVYFPPYLLPTIPKRWCVDGAVFANNPTTFTLAHVQKTKTLNLKGSQAKSVRLLAIGTGITSNTVPFAEFGHPFEWGIYRWLNPSPPKPQPEFPLPTVFWDGQSDCDDYQAGLFLGTAHYKRANVVLPKSVAIDDYAAVPEMERWTREYLRSPAWKSIKDWVKEEFM
jgi:hypothetical protein